MGDKEVEGETDALDGALKPTCEGNRDGDADAVADALALRGETGALVAAIIDAKTDVLAVADAPLDALTDALLVKDVLTDRLALPDRNDVGEAELDALAAVLETATDALIDGDADGDADILRSIGVVLGTCETVADCDDEVRNDCDVEAEALTEPLLDDEREGEGDACSEADALDDGDKDAVAFVDRTAL